MLTRKSPAYAACTPAKRRAVAAAREALIQKRSLKMTSKVSYYIICD